MKAKPETNQVWLESMNLPRSVDRGGPSSQKGHRSGPEKAEGLSIQNGSTRGGNPNPFKVAPKTRDGRGGPVSAGMGRVAILGHPCFDGSGRGIPRSSANVCKAPHLWAYKETIKRKFEKRSSSPKEAGGRWLGMFAEGDYQPRDVHRRRGTS